MRYDRDWPGNKGKWVASRRYDTCYYCRFWVGHGVRERGPKGNCRRFPPMLTARHPYGAFPVTLATDWCGEWQRTSAALSDGALSDGSAAGGGQPTGHSPDDLVD